MKITIENLTKKFGDVTAVNNFNATIESGELVALLGPSGCGKSTMLNMLSGIFPATSGKIYFDEDDVTDVGAEKRGVGLVFQNYSLYPHMTVLENIAFPLEIKKVKKAEREAKAIEMAKLVHVDMLLHRKPKELSGGQQQRVAIARALIMNPAMVLLDEPLCNLDVQLRIEMRTEMAEIFHTLHTTVFHVTHDPSEAFAMADRIIIMNNGIIDQDDIPENCYEDPASSVVAGLLGAGNKLDALVQDNHVIVGNNTLNVVMHEGCINEVELRFRAEEVEFTKENTDNSLPCTIVMPTFEGGIWRVIGKIENTEVTFLSKEKLEKGTRGYLKFDPKKVYAYAKNHH